MKNINWDLIFWLSFLFSLTLKIFAILNKPFWLDEALTYHIATVPFNYFFQAVASDSNPPLYYLLIHFLTKINDSPILLRAPSLIANLSTSILLYKNSGLISNANVSKLAAVLFSISPLSIYLASEARLHSFSTFTITLCILLFLRLLKSWSTKALLLFALSLTIAFYSQYYSILLLFPFTWIIWKKQKRNFKKWLSASLFPIGIFAPWVIYARGFGESGCYCPPSWFSLPATLISPFIGGVGPVTIRVFPHMPLSAFVLILSVAVVGVFIFIIGLSQKSLIKIIYLKLLFLLSFAGLFLPVFSPRGMAVFSPVFFIITSLGFLSFKRPKFMLSFLLLLASVSIIQVVHPFFQSEKVENIYQITQQKPNVPMAHTSILTFYSLNYYSGKSSNFLTTPNPLKEKQVNLIGGQRQDLDLQNSKVWLVDTDQLVDSQKRQETLDTLNKNYVMKETYQINSVNVYLFEKR